MRQEAARLWNLTEPYVKALGLDLIELEWGREGDGWVLRIFIDRPWSADDGPRLPGADQADELFRAPAITHEDCERASRDLSAALDVANVIPHAYRLEVSSPGLERPLRREQDFQRFSGQMAKIRAIEPVDGRRNFSGTIVGVQEGAVEIQCDGRSYRVPIDAIVRANLVPDWAAEFRRAGGGQDMAMPARREGARSPDRGRPNRAKAHRSVS
jgi:ribosome maturation factor RimP